VPSMSNSTARNMLEQPPDDVLERPRPPSRGSP
jgi:hypothetical protein